MSDPQSAAAVMMVRPAHFGVNPSTAQTNEFQREAAEGPAEAIGRRARDEFDALADSLASAGVTVCVFDDPPDAATPDSVFPNNWVSFHADGTVVLYPMLAPNRRLERRPELIARLAEEHGFLTGETLDLSPHEREGRFLEGTGSVVFDRVARVAYACLSPRTDPQLLGSLGRSLGYEVFAFEARGPSGLPIYHTNVMLAIGERATVLCAEAIDDAGRRRELLASLQQGGHEVVQITPRQMLQFAGNMLELRGVADERLLLLSRRAEACLDDSQRERLSRAVRLLPSPVETIEDCSGGSVRCMLAEIHLPRAAGA